MPRTLKLTLQYDGTDFVGWQRQPHGVSIQGLIEDALAPIEGNRVTVHGAGRTDAGVHALGQVASVSLEAIHDPATLQRALNAVLPLSVRVLAVEEMSADFHARFSATGKIYEYRIINAPLVSAFLHRYVWHVPQPLDIGSMSAAGALLVGTHDFAGFQGAGSVVRSSVRTIHAFDLQIGRGFDQPLVMRVSGDGFLRHMVRSIAGTLVDIGVGRWPPSRVAEILTRGDRAQGWPVAPPSGLFLVSVLY